MSWVTEEFVSQETEDGVRVITPNGFTMTFNDPLKDGVRVLASLVKRGDILCLPDGQTLYLDPDGSLSVLDVDVWINKGFNFKDPVSNATDLAFVLKSYLESRSDR